MTWESLFDILNRDDSDTHSPPGPPRPSSPRDSSSISPNDSDLPNREPSYDDSFIFEGDLCECECGAYHSESEGNPSKSFEDEVFEEVFEECIASDQGMDIDEELNDQDDNRWVIPPLSTSVVFNCNTLTRLSTSTRLPQANFPVSLAYILPPTPTEAERNEIWDAAMSVRDRPYARRLILEKQGGLSKEEDYMRVETWAREGYWLNVGEEEVSQGMGDGMGGDAQEEEEEDSTQELDDGSRRMADNDKVDGETDCQWDGGSDSDLGSEATLASRLEAANGEYEHLNKSPPSPPARFERESKTSGLTLENVSEEVKYPTPASTSTSKPTPLSTSTFDIASPRTPAPTLASSSSNSPGPATTDLKDEDEDENRGGGPGPEVGHSVASQERADVSVELEAVEGECEGEDEGVEPKGVRTLIGIYSDKVTQVNVI
ncbi:unnamed protein product [Cyclocybe aegerita]|uniref:Uncharacterized protein n=1 Tax=Cyclocybe aegerita TaxID=1973307 RepID=A0A8S0X194_CYCAE|nr:unnamed protein product [Cyclocybe aegerita]